MLIEPSGVVEVLGKEIPIRYHFKGIIKLLNMSSYLHGSIEVRTRIIFDFIHTCRILQF